MVRWIKHDGGRGDNGLDGDCVLRSLALTAAATVTGPVSPRLAYQTILDDLPPDLLATLLDRTRKAGLPSSRLAELLVRHGMRRAFDLRGCRLDVQRLARLTPHPTLAVVRNHTTSLVGGDVLDLWDTRRRTVVEVWANLHHCRAVRSAVEGMLDARQVASPRPNRAAQRVGRVN